MKVFTSEAQQRLSLRAAEMGADRAVDLEAGDALGASRADRWGDTWIERYFRTFGATIAAGSSEIQRNIIAERVLGLPRS